MIPSDHFVRFYNEVFKFLDEKNSLEKYYLHISSHQEFHCLKLFKDKGLQGLYEYYIKIRKEENCDMDIELKAHEFSLFMKKCPSLSKATDNDAGVCPKYCLHCAGWLLPLLTKADLFIVYDMKSVDLPMCQIWVYDERRYAVAKLEELGADPQVCSNVDRLDRSVS